MPFNPVFNDIFDGNLNDNNTTTGTNLDDLIVGDNGRDLLRGLNGNDLIFGNRGNDRLYGDAGNDELNGGIGNDFIWGGSGNDTVIGGVGFDRVYETGNFNYTLNNAQLIGNGVDSLSSIEAATLVGGNGNNSINAIAFTGVTNLYGLNGHDFIRGGSNRDYVRGGNGNDRVWGNNGNDYLYGDNDRDLLVGGSGRDYMDGGADNDTLIGGADNDVIIGGTGNDSLTSGSVNDRDIFRFNSINDRRDTIRDFDRFNNPFVAGDDRDIIQVRNSGFNATGGAFDLPNGVLPANRFALGGSNLGNRAGFRYFQNSGNLYYDSNGGGIGGSQLLATLSNRPSFASMSGSIQVV